MQHSRRPRWEDLSGDLLISIFERLSIDDLVTGVPFCCAAWRAAAAEPACWRRLDFRRWDAISRRLPAADFRRLLRFSLLRAGGAAEAVFFPHFAGELDLLFVAERCPQLRYFSLKKEEEPTEHLLHAIDHLPNLQGLAVNAAAICPQVLQSLRRRAAKISELQIFSHRMSEKMAANICQALPYLRKLVLRDCAMSQSTLFLFLEKLENLERLDIAGINAPRISEKVMEKAARLKEFVWEPEFNLAELYRCSGSCGDIFSGNPRRR